LRLTGATRCATRGERSRPQARSVLPSRGVSTLVPAAKAVVHNRLLHRGEGREADCVLVLLVKKIRAACVERNPAADVVAARDVEPRVARIARKAEAQEIAVRANAGEVSGQAESPRAENSY